MKIIFSRKGLRSEEGGIPSPIFPDATFCALPKLSEDGPSLKEMKFNERNFGWITEQLSGKRINARSCACINPDIDREALPRPQGWRPTFGQHGAPQTHLESQYIKPGDLFLFYGSFQDILEKGGGLRFRPDIPERHYIYGWLQVGKILHPGHQDAEEIPAWAETNPHMRNADRYQPNNTLYVSTQFLKILGMRRQIAGGGVFKFLRKEQCLSAREHEIGTWGLPHWMYPASRGRPPLSCHSDKSRWKREGKGILLTTVEKNEEYVLSSDFYPETNEWLKSLFDLAEVR